MGCHHGSLQGPIARRQVRAREREDGGLQESVRDGEWRRKSRSPLSPLLSNESDADVSERTGPFLRGQQQCEGVPGEIQDL